MKLKSAKGLYEHIRSTRLSWLHHKCGEACEAADLLSEHADRIVAAEIAEQKDKAR